MYDPETIKLVRNPQPPENVNHAVSLHPSFELTTHYAWPGGEGNITDEQARNQRHAYFACVSYVDAQVGKVLDELKRLKLDRNTIVVLWGDHGWHLGEHGIFGKQTNFEIATRSPLIIKTPGMYNSGQAAGGLVESVDIYPTLTDLCGLEAPENLPGLSLRPLLENPEHEGKDGTFSFFQRGQYFGRTLRTDHYRIVEWVNSKTKETVQLELYDHRKDPDENVNVAADPANKELVQKLLKQMYIPSNSVLTKFQ